MQTNHITTPASYTTLLANVWTNNPTPPNPTNTLTYLLGELITRKEKPHDLRKRTRPKKIAFRRFCTAMIAGNFLQMGEV
jgi:hypothetical protein